MSSQTRAKKPAPDFIARINGGKYMYDVVDKPEETRPGRIPGENPHTVGAAKAKEMMVSAPGKSLTFATTYGEYRKTVAQLYDAGRSIDVSMKVQATTIIPEIVDGKPVAKTVKLSTTKKDDTLKAADSATVSVTFWAVPKVTRERKPKPAETATETPAGTEALAAV